MVIKYFDEGEGAWKDITGNIGDSLIIDASGWTTAPATYKSLTILNVSLTDTGSGTPLFSYDIVQNSFAETFTLTNPDNGRISVQADSGHPFTTGKTYVIISQGLNIEPGFNFFFYYDIIDDTEIKVGWNKEGAVEGYTSGLKNATIEIRVYP